MKDLKIDDLIICKDKYNSRIDDSTVFARVTMVDRKEGFAYLDRYKKEGRVHYDNKVNAKMSLNLIESESSYYFRMTDDEILKFYEGLKDMRKISQKDGNYESTFEVVRNAADSINSRNYWKNKT